jgi:hypothetical protein
MTEPPTVSTPALVTDAAQVSALLERINQEILGALLEQFMSTSELAKMLERPLKAVIYRLETLLEVGLIRVAEERKRGGRAIRIFAPCSSVGWCFPFSLTSAATLFEQLERDMLPRLQAILRASVERVRDEMWFYFWLHPEFKTVAFEMRMPDEARFQQMMRDTTLGITTLYLTETEAVKLNLELRERYFSLMREHTDSSLKAYSVAIFFTPMSGDEP